VAPKRLLAELFYEVRARTSGLQGDLQGAEKQFGKLSEFVKANPVAAITALGVAVAGVAIQAARMAAEVETQLRRVANAVPNGIAGLDKLRDGIASVSRDTGKSQAELARNLQEIARAGVEGPEQAVQRLKAVQTAVDATGEEFGGVVEGLDQTLDLFGGASEDAARALGTLFAAAKGRTSLSDLFAQLQAAAPAINRLKLDLDTAARALVALGEKGLSAKQAASELNKLAESGATGRAAIQKLADSTPAAADGFAEMRKAADDFNNSAEQLNKRALTDFQNILLDLGRVILPPVTRQLRDFVNMIEFLTGARAERISDLGLTDLGAKFAEASRHNTEVLELQAGSFVRAAKRLSETLATGSLDVVATTTEGAEAVAAGIEHLVKVGVLKAEDVEATLARLNELTKQARAASGPLVGGRGGGGGPTADELKAQEEAAKKARAEVDQLAEKIAKLGSAQQILSGENKLSESTFADLVAEVVAARTKFPEFADDLSAMSARLVELRQAASGFDAAQLGDEMQRLLATFTTTAVDDLRLALAELQRTMRAKGATQAQIDQITALHQELIAATAASEGLDAALAEGRAGGIVPLKETASLLERRKQLEQELADLADKGAEHDATRLKIREDIAKIDARIVELQEKAAAATKVLADDAANAATKIGAAANVALGLATALFGANDAITQMIGGIANAAGGLGDLFKLAKDAGGFGTLFSSASGILSALPGIGQIIGGIGAIDAVVGESPQDRARAEQTERLVEALDRLRNAVGDLADSSLSGDVITRARRAVAGVDLSGLEGRGLAGDTGAAALLRAALKQAGITLKDLEELTGVDLSGPLGIDQIKLLKQALVELDFKGFAGTFAGQLKALELQFQLFPKDFDTAEKRAEALTKLLTDEKVGAPAIFKALSGLDLGTEEGREAAREMVRAIFTQLREGTLDPALLNGLSFPELRDILSRLFGELGGIEDELATALEQEAANLDEAKRKAIAELEASFELGDALPLERLQRLTEAFAAQFSELAGIADGLDLGTAEGINAFRERLNALFETLREGGITDEEQKLVDVLLALSGAATDAAGSLTGFTDGLVSMVDQLNAAFDEIDLEGQVFGESAAETLGKKLTAFGLGGADLASEEGRARTIADLQKAFTESQDEATKRLIAALIQSVRGLGDDVADAVGGAGGGGGGERSAIANAAQALTEVTGNRMADYLATLIILGRQEVEAIRALGGAPVAPIQAPSFSNALGAGAVVGGGGVSVVIAAGAVPVTVTGVTTDPATTGQEIGDAAARRLALRISRILTEEAVSASRTRGLVAVS